MPTGFQRRPGGQTPGPPRGGWVRNLAGQPSGLGRIASRFRAFASQGAHGESAIYEKLALAVAASPELLAFIADFSSERRQPNLFLAAVRHRHGVPQSGEELIDIVRRDGPAIRELMLSRTTQTNEPARCSALLPLLASLPQPLAIVEVGASAGLCLIPDRYGYDYGAVRLPAPTAAAPVFRCAVSGPVPYPSALPQIVWRRGLDLRPIDIFSADEVGWLETLVWPGQEDRLHGLRAALAIARKDPPPVVKGDLRTDLETLLREAPSDATLVVYHTAVLAYVASVEERRRFSETVKDSGAVWISNEAAAVFPALARNAPAPPAPGHFLLARDGTPVAWTAPHGQSLTWFGSA